MSLEDILVKIEEDKNKRKKEIEKAYEEKILEIERFYQKKIQEKQDLIILKAQERVNNELIQKEIKEKLETKNLILSKKQEILDRIYREVLAILENCSQEDYLKILISLLQKCPDTGEIFVPIGKKEITETALKKCGKNLSVFEKDINSKGGFILVSKDFEINNTFEKLINIIRESTEKEVAKILFS